MNKLHLRELKQLHKKLKSKLNEHNYCKKIYESCNLKDKLEELETISIENSELMDSISNKLSDYLTKRSKSINEIITGKSGKIDIKNYYDLLETINILIVILQFDLSGKGLIFEKIYTDSLPSDMF